MARLGVIRGPHLLAVTESAETFLAENGIDRAWLGRRLAEAGLVQADGEPTNLDATSIGTGQVGENIRCRLAWADGIEVSVVAKLPSASELSRATAAATRTYIREVGFYRDVRPLVSIRTPLPYHVSEDQARNSFILLMEDIAPAEQGDQLTGCTLDQAHLAIEAIAGLHGPTWDDGSLPALDWVDEPTEATLDDRTQLYRALFDGFAERYAERLSTEELDLGRWLGASIPRLFAAWEGPRCLAHGDFRLDNLLFGTGPGAPPITTVDWQTVSFGYGLADVAYFLSAGLTPTDRQEAETALLRTYRTAMANHGVNLDDDEIRQGYRLGSASGYAMAVIASQIVEQTERGDAMFIAMARGSAAQLRDVDLPGLISG